MDRTDKNCRYVFSLFSHLHFFRHRLQISGGLVGYVIVVLFIYLYFFSAFIRFVDIRDCLAQSAAMYSGKDNDDS